MATPAADTPGRMLASAFGGALALALASWRRWTGDRTRTREKNREEWIRTERAGESYQ